jgi:2,4-dienoyl-CoA reductase-like NADH-dependent reductase (Old Yellow Enzyme family)
MCQYSANDGLGNDWHVQHLGARRLAATGQVDLIDCSSGGVAHDQTIPSLHSGYQVPFADAIRNRAGIATGAVGLISEPTTPLKSSPMAAPTWCCWREHCWPIRPGRCARRRHSA